ncbi:MAG TPA: hypothetical protein VKV37_22365 [Ktedonobacteraceae bacterium]|nr:hypothetical protein [Ktedonobacteraceae bacterium]
MSYIDQARFSRPLPPISARTGSGGAFPPGGPGARNGQFHDRFHSARSQEAPVLYGEALARDPWAEQYGPWIVLGFTVTFALFLIVMNLAGQVPGKSFTLKSISDILQFIGEGIGFIFCVRIAARLHRTSLQLHHDLLQKESGRHTPGELAIARSEAQVARRAFLAWTFLSIAIALYASGQAVWTSYDVRMNSADVPFPGIYDLGFVGSYPFFLIGTMLLTRRNKATVGRTRLILDALAVIGVSLALSWFFYLGPSIATLSQAPSAGAAFLSVYFPTGDLFLVAVGALLMFSPLSNRAQQPVFLRLCLGLFFLAITDSLLGYYSISTGFNTGTLQDVLWPLSMALVGLAAIAYPRSIAQEQENQARINNAGRPASPLSAPGRIAQITTTAQTIAPFILVLATCAILLTVIAPRGGSVLLQADIIALVLILIVVVRQALTLLENNRLTMQMRGELVISRRELQVTRREADEATRTVQEKRILEEGVATLREIHARVARGDFAARAPTVPGPLLPIAISLNLMLDRLSALSQRGSRYDQLVRECKTLQVAIERLAQGLPAWPPNQAPQGSSEMRSVFLGLVHLQRSQEGQWRRLANTLESMSGLIRRLYEALHEVKQSHIFADGQASFERMSIERMIREVELLEQQQRSLLGQISQYSTRFEQPITINQNGKQAAPSRDQQEQSRFQRVQAAALAEQAQHTSQSNSQVDLYQRQSGPLYPQFDGHALNHVYPPQPINRHLPENL